MPYIKQDDRCRLNDLTSQLEFVDIETAGELNYLLTCVCQKYIEYHGLSYRYINDVVGALEGAKLEFYRRVAAPYEDKKIVENGDVYSSED